MCIQTNLGWKVSTIPRTPLSQLIKIQRNLYPECSQNQASDSQLYGLVDSSTETLCKQTEDGIIIHAFSQVLSVALLHWAICRHRIKANICIQWIWNQIVSMRHICCDRRHRTIVPLSRGFSMMGFCVLFGWAYHWWSLFCSLMRSTSQARSLLATASSISAECLSLPRGRESKNESTSWRTLSMLLPSICEGNLVC